ncbi:hypothetical protein BCT40_15235 [Vibrio lentus]|uniref:hypothetical protein n=1 Tax=Vibrio lentus TaxID=136468 RepID=UPI000C832B56|nr:hypothetical protein [Vibrio lentus]PME61616.1 hypothetical protein BCV33_22090 [Vibrio lentus]PMG65504.1 hypothetical protein BCU87_06140 [Vibrio lentus]PMM97096.1 hypothetical protein BCT40_15235 [Vibrio lentus]TKF40447.1 hypothetical protein FCV64_20440 [Vibrio lentus]
MTVLYRGFSEVMPEGKLSNIFLDAPRHPKETPIQVHEAADEWFLDRFKIKARSQTILCTNCLEQAEIHAKHGGSLTKLTPIQPYKIIYSELVYDFTDYFADVNDRADANEILRWLETRDYKIIDDIKKLPTDFSGEVMLSCSEFHIENMT